jgi:hypothetical protein
MNQRITRESLIQNGFKNVDERVYFLNDLGYEFGFTHRAVVKVKHGFILLKDIQYMHELSDLNYALTGKKLLV